MKDEGKKENARGSSSSVNDHPVHSAEGILGLPVGSAVVVMENAKQDTYFQISCHSQQGEDIR